MKRDEYSTGRLTAKPDGNPVNATMPTGIQSLQLSSKKENFIYIPQQYNSDTPASLAVMLHGSGGVAEHGLYLINQYADADNIIVFAPASQDYTWDVIAGEYFGMDVIFLDHALQTIFDRYAIDASQIAIGGFSDGASYALCLGLINGDLFNSIIAFSPGFFYATKEHGRPEVFISHGVHDRVLPIDSCSRRIVPRLNNKGLAVSYHEFNGEHEIPADIRKEAVEWFARKAGRGNV